MDNEWIKVSHKLPKDDQIVLVWYIGMAIGNATVAFYEDGHWFGFHTHTSDRPIPKPSHWMVLPKAPKD